MTARSVVLGADGTAYKAAEETSWRHSFDQRLLFDGQDFIFMDLADAGWYTPGGGLSLRKIKLSAGAPSFVGGREGVYVYVRQAETAGMQNFCFTSLGDLAQGARGYLALFASEKNNVIVQRSGSNEPVAEPRNVGVVHVAKSFDTVMEGRWNGGATLGNTIIDGEPTAIHISRNVVDSPGIAAHFARPDKPQKTFTQTGIVWLTALPSGTSAERPKLIQLADDRYVALWEEWSYQGKTLRYLGTKAMLLNEACQVLKAAVDVKARLNPSGADRLFLLDGKAAWITGSGAGSWQVALHTLDANLALMTTSIALPRPKPAGPGMPQNPLYTGEATDPANSMV